jgi:hypothetical protein
MNKPVILILSLLFLCCSENMFAQVQPVLVNQHRPSKKITLKKEWDVSYITTKGNYNGQVLSGTDSSLRISRYYKSGKDSSYTVKKKVSRRYPEGIKTKKYALYNRDTSDILLKDILMVKKPWINKRGWMLIPAYMAGGAVLAIPLLPVAAISNGSAGVRNWLQFEALLVGISGPSIFMGTRNKKYVLGEKWKLVVE